MITPCAAEPVETESFARELLTALLRRPPTAAEVQEAMRKPEHPDDPTEEIDRGARGRQ